MRAFISIFPPKEILPTFRETQDILEKKYRGYFRCVRVDQIHLTIRFLGEVDHKKIEDYSKILCSKVSSIPQFNLRLHEAGFGFRDQRNPRIIFISVMRAKGLLDISKGVETTIQSVFEEDEVYQETQPDMIYHFTLARAKRRVPSKMIKSIRHFLSKVTIGDGFMLNDIYIVKSELFRAGSSYTVLKRCTLHEL